MDAGQCDRTNKDLTCNVAFAFTFCQAREDGGREGGDGGKKEGRKGGREEEGREEGGAADSVLGGVCSL